MQGMMVGSIGSSHSNHSPHGLLIGAKNNSFGSSNGGRKSHNTNRLSNGHSSNQTNSNYGVALIEEATIDAENEEDTPLKQKPQKKPSGSSEIVKQRGESVEFLIEEEVKEIQYGVDFVFEQA